MRVGGVLLVVGAGLLSATYSARAENLEPASLEQATQHVHGLINRGIPDDDLLNQLANAEQVLASLLGRHKLYCTGTHNRVGSVLSLVGSVFKRLEDTARTTTDPAQRNQLRASERKLAALAVKMAPSESRGDRVIASCTEAWTALNRDRNARPGSEAYAELQRCKVSAARCVQDIEALGARYEMETAECDHAKQTALEQLEHGVRMAPAE